METVVEVKKPKTYSEADWHLLDMIRQSLPIQHNKETDEDYYDAGFIRSNCEAMYYLCTIGMLKPTIKSEEWDFFYRTFCAKELDPPIER